MSHSRQIAANTISQWIVTVLSSALGLLLVPFLIVKLGADGYGLIAVATAITGACILADLGISGALSRELAAALAEKDEARYQRLLNSALGMNALTGLACSCIVFFASGPLGRSLALHGPLFGSGVLLLRIYGAPHVLFTFLMTAPRAVLESHHRFDRSNMVDGLRRLFEALGLFLVLANTAAGIWGWAAICLASDIPCMWMLWRMASRTHGGLEAKVLRGTRSGISQLFGLGTRLTIFQLSGQLSVNVDPIILAFCLGTASVALYRPPAQVLGVLSTLVMCAANQIHPLTTRAHVTGDMPDLIAILFRGTRYTMLLGAVSSAMVICLAEPLCKVWLGRALGSQYEVCVLLLVIQAFQQLCAFAQGTQWAVLFGIRQTNFASYGRLVFALLNVSSSWFLVRYTGLGVIGVVIPTLVAEVIWRPVLCYYVCRKVNVSIRAYLREAYYGPLAIGLVVAGLGFAVRSVSPAETLLSLASTAGIIAVAAAILIWFWGLRGHDRTALLAMLHPEAA